MRSVFEELKALIDYIQGKYSEITTEWMQGKIDKINMKKSKVSDIEVNNIIYENIKIYHNLLVEKHAYIAFPFPSVCSYKVTSRVKTPNSIEYKIKNYKTEQHDFGKVSVNKCFNDLFGSRIILEDPLAFEEIQAFIQESYQGKYRCIDSSKLDYRAVHLYFKENNQSFPWELQIWNRCDIESNFASHKKYKQGYTVWEKESKEARK